MFNCDDIRGAVTSLSLVESCDTVANGMLRMATPFKYPNGASIDLFLGPSTSLFDGYILTDLGETAAELLDIGIKPWTTAKRKQIMSDICGSLDVQRDGSEFRIYLEDLKDLPSAMVRLAQACVRVSDLAFTYRNAVPAGFKDDVEEYISSLELPYERDQQLTGRHGNAVTIDFSVTGKRVPSLILTLSSANPASSHGVANEVFRKWYDLHDHRASNQFISVLDARAGTFREEDIARVSDVSSVLEFPQQEAEIRDALAA